MASTHTLTGNVYDLTGATLGATGVRVTVVTNLPAKSALIDKTTNSIHLGGKHADLDPSTGLFTIDLIDTSATDLNVAANTLEYEVRAEYVNPATRVRSTWTSGWFPFTADANLADITTDVEPLAVESASGYALEAKGYRDETATISGLTGEDAAVAFLVEDSGSATAGALSATYAARDKQALLPSTLARPTVTAIGTDPVFVDYFDGYMWGMNPTNGDIFRSNDEGVTWSAYCNSFNGPENTILRIVPTADGEVLVLCSHGLFKSSGWAGGNTATWSASKVTSTGAGGIFDAFSLDGDGQKFIVGEYGYPQVNWADSRYAYISTDAGTTFVQKWDSNTNAPLSAPGDSHIHAVCYDPFADRFYVSEGHGAGGGVYCSTNDGTSWARAEGMKPPATSLTNGPTVIVATDDGLVMGSDNSPENGLWGVARKADPADEVMVQTYNLVTAAAGLITFAQRGFRDPDTGHVFISFRAEANTTPLVIAAGTPFNGGEVYRHTLPAVGGTDRIVALAKIDGTDRLVARMYAGGAENLLRGTLTRPGGKDRSLADTGNVQGGRTADILGVAVGPGSRANGSNSTAVGRAADAVQTGGTAIGDNARALNVGSVAVGRNTTAGNNGVAIGDGVTTTNPNEFAIGGRFIDMDRLATLPGEQLANHLHLFQGVNPKNSKGVLLAKFGGGVGRRVLASEGGFRSVFASETLDRHDDMIVINVAANSTITLPSGASFPGIRITLKNVQAFNATIQCAGAETIDGVATKVLTQWQYVTLLAHTGGWYVIG